MRLALVLPSWVGAIFFGGAFALSLLDPLLVERAARQIVRHEVEHRVGEKVDTFSNSRIAGMAQKALQKTDIDIDHTRQVIRIELPRKVADVVADMLNADCECRKRLIERAQRGESERLSSLVQLRERLVSLIEGAYASVTAHLMREFRIFTASNAVSFVVLGLLMHRRRKATLQLLLPALVLVGAVAVTGGLYLFNQNWLGTVVFGEYIGLGYTFYLAAVALLLTDVVFNRTRVTTRLVNLVFQAVGSAATVTPC